MNYLMQKENNINPSFAANKICPMFAQSSSTHTQRSKISQNLFMSGTNTEHRNETSSVENISG